MALVGCAGWTAPASLAGPPVQTTTFFFANVGMSYRAFLPPEDSRVGQEVVETRIYLAVQSLPGSDAANFFTDIALPIEPFPGNENGIVLEGAALGWSGPGVFKYTETTTRFNGHFVTTSFGAETPGEDFDGEILPGSRIEVDYRVEPMNQTGDMNCDGVVSVSDIGPFILALTDPAGYVKQFPGCDLLNGDTNGDLQVSVGDIGGLVALLGG